MCCPLLLRNRHASEQACTQGAGWLLAAKITETHGNRARGPKRRCRGLREITTCGDSRRKGMGHASHSLQRRTRSCTRVHYYRSCSASKGCIREIDLRQHQDQHDHEQPDREHHHRERFGLVGHSEFTVGEAGPSVNSQKVPSGETALAGCDIGLCLTHWKVLPSLLGDPAAAHHDVCFIEHGRLPWSDGTLRLVKGD